MDNKKMGCFIAELRKSNKMTQKDLAMRLSVTDKAVSKWERGLSCPDISLLIPLSEVFGVTVGELLNGKRNIAEVEENADNVIVYAEEAIRRKANGLRSLFSWVISVSLLVGVIICIICDHAVSGKLSWSLYVISSAVLAWSAVFPAVRFKKYGILFSLISISLLIIPFLAVIDLLIPGNLPILAIGVRVACISVIFLWIIYISFRVLSDRKYLSLGITLVCLGIACCLINMVVSEILLEPVTDIWDLLSYVIIATTAVICFIKDKNRNSKDGKIEKQWH